jgi:Ser/Thr protein kinase RdoA (MazF antagonist)
MPQSVLPAFGLEDAVTRVEAFGSGLINHTWKVTSSGKEYILQRVNDSVFEQPANIAHNIKIIADYLHQHYPEYCFIAPLISSDGHEMIYVKDDGFYRLFPFVANSHSKDVVEAPEQAFEAATQFGKFTRLLKNMDVNELKITIPHFHDLDLRYKQFVLALEQGKDSRIKESKELIDILEKHADIVTIYQHIQTNPAFIKRVTHHDTKISNVLFTKKDEGICVIDLDTVMPGYFISDVGDMMRTYLSPVSEEEKDFEKITVRDEFYKAIVQGYYNQMKDVLTATEKDYFFYAGKFMIYMQALRFLTDHLNDDVYYGARYPGQNLVRAGNQVTLLQRLLEKEDLLKMGSML